MRHSGGSFKKRKLSVPFQFHGPFFLPKNSENISSSVCQKESETQRMSPPPSSFYFVSKFILRKAAGLVSSGLLHDLGNKKLAYDSGYQRRL